MEIKYGCQGLVAVVSGGTSGIGLAVAQKLVQEYCTVFVLGRSPERGQVAEAMLQLMASSAGKAKYIPCDVADTAACQSAVEAIKVELKTAGLEPCVQILVNSAGIYEEERLEQMSDASYGRIMDTNVKGTMQLTQALLPLLYGGGAIVNVASDAGISGNYGCPVYCASKGAVVSMTKALALDLAPAIRVNCVCPADVDTPLLQRQLAAAEGSYTVEEMAEVYPLGRIGTAEEIAHVICSLVSPANSFMTGAVVPVDGGLTAK